MTDLPVSTDAPDTGAPTAPLEGGKYVYCIIRSDRHHDFGTIGIGGEGKRVYTVR